MEAPEPIAVVGMGCRFPGANNLDEYWRVLTKGENHVLEVPPDRWNVDAYYDPDAPGKTCVRKVGIVNGDEEFGNSLFDINDIEASEMDPQQRLVLASFFMALEDGGFKLSDLSGSNTGVYVGVMNHDYMDILSSDMTRADNYNLTGGTTSITAARISFAFNLLGPAMVVETACSSALTSDVGKIILEVFRLCGFRKLSLIISKNFESNTVISSNILVLMSNIELTSIFEAGNTNDNIRKILLIEGMAGVIGAGQIARVNTNTEVTQIYPRNMFLPFYLLKTVPKINIFINKHWNLLSQLFRCVKKSHFKAFSCGVGNLTRDRGLSVVMNRDTLFHENASYVVVGGLGGLGWITVCMIAEMGGGLLATVSRRPPNDEMRNKMAELRNQTGVEIVCLQADVTDGIDITKALNQFSANYQSNPIRGIFQSDGIFDDSSLINMTNENFERVALPKIKGTLNLHQASLNFHLDYFVMYSSVVSIIGNPGQSNYGAGNSFMDSFAHYRRQHNLPGQSINWGPLEAGMALSNPHIAQQLQKIGYLSLNEEQIKECLVHAIINNAPQVCYMDFHWSDKHKHILLSPVIRDVMMNRDQGYEDHFCKQMDLETLAEQPPHIRFTHILEYTQDVLAAVLSVDKSVIDSSTDLTALGLDSILLMTLSNKFRRDLHLKITNGDILNGISVQSLVLFINAKISEKNNYELDEVTKYDTLPELRVPLLSPIQQHIFQTHVRRNGETDVKLAAEIILDAPIEMSFLREAIQLVIERNTQLRTIYKVEHGKVIPVCVEHLKVDDFFAVVSCKPQNMWKLVCETAKERFDLSSQLPIKALCLETKTVFRIGFVFHQICFDLKSMQLFFKDFRAVCLSKAAAKDLDPVAEIDASQEFQSTLAPVKGKLEEHWHSQINGSSKISMISFSPEYKGEIFGEYRTTEIELPSDVLTRIKLVLAYLKITPFQFYASVQQLLLHLISGHKTIPLKTLVDVRLFIPSLQNVIARCANGVPILANISTEENIQHYLVQNSKNIAEAVLHGLYPQGLITSQIPYDKSRDLFRHTVVLEDMSDFRAVLNEGEQYGLDLINYGPVHINSETRLVIWSERHQKTMKLQLDYLPSLVNDETAQSLLHAYKTLIDWVLDNRNSLVSDIPHSIYGNCVIHGESSTDQQETTRLLERQNENGKPDSRCNQLGLMTAGCYFQKITRQGVERQVFLILQTDGTSSRLQWGDSERKLSRQIHLRQITKIYWNIFTDRHLLIIRTSGRRFYFVAPNERQAKQWMDGFRALLQRNTAA